MATENLGYAFNWLANNMFGELQLANFDGCLGKQEQDIASAASAIETSDSGLVGAPHYVPVFFCGRRPVRGVNYVFVAVKTQATNPPLRKLVQVECNFFDGKYEMVKSMEKDLS